MLKSLFVLFVFSVVGLLAGVISWINWGFLVGFEVFVGCFLLGFTFSAASIFFIKTLSTLDVFLPIPVSLVWCILILPLKVSTDLISPVTMVLSAFLLTYSLWMYKQRQMSKAWIVIPILMFLYEMLPVDFPGPFDDMLAVVGSTGSALLQSIVILRSKSLFNSTSKVSDASALAMPESSVTEIALQTHSLDNISTLAPDTENATFEVVDEQQDTKQQNDIASLGDEIKSLGSEFVKLAWSKPKIKQAIIEKANEAADALKTRIDRS